MHISDIISSLQGITTATDGYTADMYDQQIHTKPTTDPQILETTFSTNGYKTVKLSSDNGMTSPGISQKPSHTGVKSLTLVAEDKPRAEALTNLSGLMSIVSSNPYKRFPQKANEKNTPPSEEDSFKSVRPLVHSFVEPLAK